MKKQIMTAFAVSTMMTLAMPFASFAVARSCQTGFRPENNAFYGAQRSPFCFRTAAFRSQRPPIF